MDRGKTTDHRRLLNHDVSCFFPDQRYSSIQKHSRATPASYGSSMEIAPYNQAASSSSSVDFRDRRIESHCKRKTSTELLKVLNKIWSLEEQHSANVAVIKELKSELKEARLRVREMEEVMKEVVDEKTVRNVREELEKERRTRKRSETMHRKIARELAEAKNSVSEALNEVEKERGYRKTMEELCDEFARGVKMYDQEVRVLRRKCERDWVGKGERDQMIVHLSESWLDEHMQMKGGEEDGKRSVLDKLGLEVEEFLKSRKAYGSKLAENRSRERRVSMESVRLNDAMSAPRAAGEEDESEGTDSNCFKINHLAYHGRGKSPSQLQVKFEAHGSSTAEMGEIAAGIQNEALEKEQTLKAKLIEVRQKAPRARLKGFRSSTS